MDRWGEYWAMIDWERWAGPAIGALRIVGIIVVAWVAIAVLSRLIRALRERIDGRLGGVETARRAETLGRVVRYLVTVVISGIAFMMVLSEVGISLAPILGAAGVVGVAVGFGAQSLVKDYFSGFFLLFEDQIRTGDVVKVAGIGGLVEDITLRHVRLRDYDGNVHFVPNGLITTVTNMGRAFAFAVIDAGVAYREDIDEVIRVMREVAAALKADDAFSPKILQDLEVAGVERLADSAVIVRARFKVMPLAQWDVRREYLKRLKRAFDERGIEIPYPHLTVYAGHPRTGAAPAFEVLARRAPHDARAQDAAAPQTGAPAS